MTFRFLLKTSITYLLRIVSGLGGVGGVGGTSPSVTVKTLVYLRHRIGGQLPPSKQVPLISGGKKQ